MQPADRWHSPALVVVLVLLVALSLCLEVHS